MTTSPLYTFHTPFPRTEARTACEAVIDPDFDAGTEELERQFDELRFARNHD